MTVPTIGVTSGDPGGIGPEIVVKTLARAATLPRAAYVLFADPRVIEAEERRLGLRTGCRALPPGGPAEEGVFLAAVPGPDGSPAVGRVTAENGEASFRAFEAAVEAARAGRLQAVVTAPISKAAWALAGHPFPGHTEYLAGFYPGAVMTFWSERLKVALFSHHKPLREAAASVRADALARFLGDLQKGLSRAPGGPYRLLLAGLNPHAGEDGRLGREEIDEIRPAVEKAAAAGIPVAGPYPPDIVFLEALGKKDVMAVALYHDQGLIPFKLLAFSTGVNVTLGLPFVRTSPDHGTAFDIAGQDVADHRSLAEAVRLAAAFSGTGS
ncbi:MAG TPA: 4-hydroxythreonine-4-phosphate dehydrogenase PdxA [Candidatus Aminicenantes bacterium]|nr:4-hydroxythreonine-4-phosphate dehydrogenase PdxA [Candidatus Aminicenantes bacterium]HRY64198.1 4-hydroxythreonine-4-phosphate dehydrogenase PdxA [Candidatus Aminicenantes bacterium]HRZ71111.1 4-hydroxythreonine-4-phosphate dehydrogenase PdxA [Candidatus Aminicenantes bacterium]